jgi:hypothetical protein
MYLTNKLTPKTHAFPTISIHKHTAHTRNSFLYGKFTKLIFFSDYENMRMNTLSKYLTYMHEYTKTIDIHAYIHTYTNI